MSDQSQLGIWTSHQAALELGERNHQPSTDEHANGMGCSLNSRRNQHDDGTKGDGVAAPDAVRKVGRKRVGGQGTDALEKESQGARKNESGRCGLPE
jgi:hypothetical protein